MTTASPAERPPAEMELRVAKAVCAEAGGAWEKYTADERAREVRSARAAIRALLWPTNEMVDRGRASSFYGMLAGWQAMIDAASPPD